MPFPAPGISVSCPGNFPDTFRFSFSHEVVNVHEKEYSSDVVKKMLIEQGYAKSVLSHAIAFSDFSYEGSHRRRACRHTDVNSFDVMNRANGWNTSRFALWKSQKELEDFP
jgi:hypothetical protein